MNAHLLAGVLIALIYFTAGVIMMTKAGEPSSIFGYRTRTARRNMDTWVEANQFAGRSIMIVGSLLILLLLLLEGILPEPEGFYPALAVSIIVGSAIVFLLTEVHLKKIFFKDGKRRPYR
ncbi:MAG: SdpI family protein [Bacteroidota bacterium]